ncbi:MAG TPA: hypothetical protein VNA69_21335 [Thermoanaerobaculia bacterium]|nr:hypothetical protein [Thermoanaerobaculia bacterium]
MAPVVSADESPYKSMRSRSIKAVSEEDIRAYREGAGMRLALPAELNGYPGPRHILELARELELAAPQRTAIEQIHDRMHNEAVSLGTQIVDLERALDEGFRDSRIEPARLAELTAGIATLQGRLRYTHLVAHIEARGVLTPRQVHEYMRLRGYTGDGEHSHHKH